MSPAPTDTILRLDRSDREDLDADENDYVLLKVARTDVKGSDLSLNLTATEGLAVFVHDLTQKRIEGIRAPNYRGSEEEFDAALRRCLLEEPIPPEHAENLAGLEIIAYKSTEGRKGEDETLHVVIRQQISGIVQRLATIDLPAADDELDIIAWASTAVRSATSYRDEAERLKEQLHIQLTRAEKLQVELEEFLDRKRTDEDEMLNKFAALLNSKKLKIRELQRAMAQQSTAAPAQDVKSEDSPPPEPSTRRGTRGALDARSVRAAPARSKRKAKSSSPSATASSSDEFETLPRDEATARSRPTSTNQETPAASEPDDDTASATEDDAAEPTVPPPRKLGRVGGGKAAASVKGAKKRARGKGGAKVAEEEEEEEEDEDGDEMEVEMELPPPRRELPHRRTRAATAEAEAEAEKKRKQEEGRMRVEEEKAEGEEDGSETDDEL